MHSFDSHGPYLTAAAILLLLCSCHDRGRTSRVAPRTDAARPADPGLYPRTFPTARAALADLLRRRRPVVVGFGELHQKTDSRPVLSALERFRREMLTELARQATDLVVETWVTEGRCGAKETQVTAKVEKSTDRPVETESEVVRLLKGAKALGVQPHILSVSCKEYDKLLDTQRGGQLDFEKLLDLITRHLRERTLKVLAYRRARVDAGAQRRRPPLVAIYGGALHNDLFPLKELQMFSYAAAMQKATGKRYLEVDLYVPELLDADETLKKMPWYARARTLSGADHVLVLERGPGSYILVLKRGVPPAAQSGDERPSGAEKVSPGAASGPGRSGAGKSGAGRSGAGKSGGPRSRGKSGPGRSGPGKSGPASGGPAS